MYQKRSYGSASISMLRMPGRRTLVYIAFALAMTTASYATEGGSSVYPAGVETVLPGLLPSAGATNILNFENFYQANELVGSNGKALVPGFHLRVSAAALKVAHNWGLHLLGGTLASTAALPLLDIYLNAPFGSQNKVGFGNPDLETMIFYAHHDFLWWYGVDGYTPGFSYNKTDLVNIGQHNFATGPMGAFTYMPHHGRTEISSKYQYIVNFADDATHYRSGNEFLWEFDGMQTVTRKVAIGGNGYYYQQTTNDLQNGLIYLDGNLGRNVEFGPEIRCHFQHYVMALKWEKDFATENRPVGNSFWIQFGIPLGKPHPEQ